MMTITLDKNVLKRDIYLLTAAKSRFMHKEGISLELNTFDLEDSDKETKAEFSGSHTGITVGETIIEGTVADPVVKNICKITVTTGAISSGIANVTLDQEQFLVPLTNSDGDETLSGAAYTANELATFTYPGWTVSRSGAVVTYERVSAVPVVADYYSFENVEESNGHAAGTVATMDGPKVLKSISFAYPIADIKDEIALLTKQKARNVTDANGLSLIDRIAFTGKVASALVVSPEKSAIYTLCRQITAKRGAFLANDTIRFENVILTADDETLFGSFYTKAFSDLLGYISPMLDSHVYDTSFTITAGFIGSVSTGLKPKVESYLKASCLAQFYSIIGSEKDIKENEAEALTHLAAIHNMLTAQADADKLLKSIITDAALKAQTALYPLSKRADGALVMYEYGATNVTFKFELKEMPISSSAIQLLYNLVQSVLINGAQAEWYTMAGIADDKNEAKKELETNLSTIAFLVEDRLRFVGLFDQLFNTVSTNIRQALLAYTKDLTVDSYSLVANIASFNLEIADWEAQPTKSAFINNLAAAMYEAAFRGVLVEWWRISDNEEFAADMEKLTTAFKSIKATIELRHTPVRRGYSWM